MAADRVMKFYEDAERLCKASTGGGSSSTDAKVVAEVNKLKTWLMKHQNEVMTDAMKAKLLQTVSLYHRLASASSHAESGFTNAITALLSDYLMMPEGKLVSSKDKKKVMNWLESSGSNASTAFCDTEKESEDAPSLWTIQDVNEEQRTVTLLNIDNEDKWLEDVLVPHSFIWDKIIAASQRDNLESLKLSLHGTTYEILDVIT